MIVRDAGPQDTDALLRLYRRVAANPGGIARTPEEIDADWIAGCLSLAAQRGIALLAEDEGDIVGEIHAWTPGPACFAHVLSQLTIVTDPDRRGQGIGRRLFEHLLKRVIDELHDIQRVELIARSSNQGALRLYESMGFRREGAMKARIRNPDGGLEDDIPMAWLRQPA